MNRDYRDSRGLLIGGEDLQKKLDILDTTEEAVRAAFPKYCDLPNFFSGILHTACIQKDWSEGCARALLKE